jgi:hypothetical protein
MSAPEETYPFEPELEFVFEVRARVSPPIELGEVDGTKRRIVPIDGGVVDGPRLKGKVVAGGADWQRIHGDGLTEILARYVIETDDGALISVVNQGIRRASAPVMKRLLAGERVDPSLIYFRAAPTFEVGEGPHAWLGRNLFISAGKRAPDGVEIKVYMVR